MSNLDAEKISNYRALEEKILYDNQRDDIFKRYFRKIKTK